MRRVQKGGEPQTFVDWKELKNDDWVPSYGLLGNPQKRHLLDALLAEQFFRCCYCGVSISAESAHIEHFRPQEAYEELELAFSNLHASCLRELTASTPSRCGHAKGNWFEEDCHVSPQDAGCEGRFRYLADGSIKANVREDAAATRMIEVLKLTVPVLTNMREDVIAAVFDREFLLTATIDDFRAIAANWTIPDAAGKQSTMCHAVSRFAEQLIESA